MCDNKFLMTALSISQGSDDTGMSFTCQIKCLNSSTVTLKDSTADTKPTVNRKQNQDGLCGTWKQIVGMEAGRANRKEKL